MTGAEIIDLAKVLSWGISEIGTADMSTLLNMAYKDFYQRILSLDKNYFWDKWTADVVEWQSEYSFLESDWATNTFWFKKPEKIRIKYYGDTYFKPVFLTDWDNLTETPERYAENQSPDKPIGIITDTKYVEIYPTPLTSDTENWNVTGGLIFEWAKEPYGVDSNSVESDFLISPLYHEVIAWIMRDMMLDYRKETSESWVAEAKAERKVLRALKQMGVLKTGAIYWHVKPNRNLE